MTTNYDVAIVGGGIIGLTAALGIAQRGFSVAVIDHGPLSVNANKKSDPRVFAINHASQKLLSSLGVWSSIDAKKLSPYQHMLIWDASSQGSIEFDARMIVKDKLGFIVEESVIRAVLLQALAVVDNITLFPKHTIDQLTQQEKRIQLHSGKYSWTVPLLVAADGANSPCRTLLNVPMTTWPYNQHAVVATVTTELPHNKTAYQVFNPEGPLAFLPLANPQQCSIVWSTTPERAKELLALSEESFNQALTEAFAGRLGAITCCGERYQFPLVMRHVQQYVDENWVLMGDAAHTIHPLAGLGLNLGLADVADWFSVLDKSPGKLPTKKYRAVYQRSRKNEVWQVILLRQSLKALFGSTLPPVRFLRGFGLKCCDHLSLLKRLGIGYAQG